MYNWLYVHVQLDINKINFLLNLRHLEMMDSVEFEGFAILSKNWDINVFIKHLKIRNNPLVI